MLGQKNTVFERFASRVDIHQSSMYAKTMESIGWKTVGKSPSQIFVKKLGPVAIAKMQRPARINKKFIQEVRKKYHTLTFHLDPALKYGTYVWPLQRETSTNSPDWDQYFKSIGFSRHTSPLAHSATSLIDLRLSESELLHRMKQKTRYNIGLAERKRTITTRTVPFESFTKKDLSMLFTIRSQWNKRKHLFGYDEPFLRGIVSSFKNHGYCLFAEIRSNVVATLIVLEWNKTATYFCAYSTPEGNILYAPTLLAWTAMKTSKKSGNDILDFGGIYDHRFHTIYKQWKGFTKFKEGFSAEPFLYPQSYIQYGW